MPLRSAIADFHSLAFTLARTAARSGASRVLVVSTACDGVASTLPTPKRRAATNARPSFDLLITVPRPLRFAWREHVAATVLGERAGAREREVRTAHHHLLGDHAIDELAPRLHGQRSVLVVGALPLGVRAEQRRHVGRVVGDHELLAAGADMECRVPRRMPRRADEA